MYARLLASLILVVLLSNNLHGEIIGFTETFDGTGDCQGFDDCGWGIFGDGQLDGAGVFRMETTSEVERGFEVEFIRNVFFGQGSFLARVELEDVDIYSPFDIGGRELFGTMSFGIDLGDRNFSRVTIGVIGDGASETTVWAIVSGQGNWAYPLGGPGPPTYIEIGSDLDISWAYDTKMSEITLRIETNGQLIANERTFVPFVMGDVAAIEIFTDASGTGTINGELEYSRVNLGIDYMEVVPIALVPGDFTADEMVTAADINRLDEAIRTNYRNLGFDLDNDQQVTEADREVLIHDALHTYFGDSNLDGEFNSGDLVEVFMAGEYEDGIELNSTWATGDWSGNGEFDSADLVFAFQDGGYEQGPRRPVATAAAVNTVPEPSLPVLLLALVGGAMFLRRRTRVGNRG